MTYLNTWGEAKYQKIRVYSVVKIDILSYLETFWRPSVGLLWKIFNPVLCGKIWSHILSVKFMFSSAGTSSVVSALGSFCLDDPISRNFDYNHFDFYSF